jgi:hypothetical protein
MNASLTIASTLVAAGAAALVGCGGIPYRARPAPVLSPDVTERGEPIYLGTVYARGATAAAEPVYVYERRVERQGAAIVATHVTRDPAGVIQLAETARSSPDYRLATYTLHANQLGHTGTIRVEGDAVTFRVQRDGREQVRVERQRAPIVVGPTLVGYIVTHLDELATRTLAVRFAVLDRLETIGFELHTVDAGDGEVRVRLEPASFFVGLFVDPTDFTFDRGTRRLVRIEGLVPTKLRAGNRWKDFDARVEYRFAADRYL